jgi:TRAP-type C4-dicarboxylate transport system permease small subunit
MAFVELATAAGHGGAHARKRASAAISKHVYSSSFERGSLSMKLAVFSVLDRLIAALLALAGWLALPIVVLLFLQWPLRDVFRVYSREANDLGQWIFAIYVAVSVTCATRAGTHLGTDAVFRFYPAAVRRGLVRVGAALLVPWAAFVLLGSKDVVLNSMRGLEAFPDTNNPGYFLIKTAVWILAGLMLTQAAIDIAQPRRTQ